MWYWIRFQNGDSDIFLFLFFFIFHQLCSVCIKSPNMDVNFNWKFVHIYVHITLPKKIFCFIFVEFFILRCWCVTEKLFATTYLLFSVKRINNASYIAICSNEYGVHGEKATTVEVVTDFHRICVLGIETTTF